MKVETHAHDNVSLKNLNPTNYTNPSSSKSIQKPSSKSEDSSPVDQFSLKKSDSEKASTAQESVSRIMQNAVSKVQTSDAALHKIQLALKSGKDLAVQASHKTTSVEQRRAIQERLYRINQQIDSTNQTIPRNGARTDFIKGINPDNADIIHSLKSDWFEASENLVENRYGLKGDGSVLKIVLEESNPKYLAAIDYRTDDSGKAATEALHINAKAAIPATLPNGGLAPQYDDRVIAHEMVHAIMGRTMNYASLPTWFKEGTAEFLPGADERIATSLNNNGGGMSGAIALKKDLGDGTNKTWKDDSDHYSAATMAVRYLHDNIKSNGHSGGIKDLLGDLAANPTENLDDALSHVSSFKNVDEFVKEYVKQGAGADYIFNLYQNHAFSNADVGAIGGQDADGGPVLTAETVVPDMNDYSETPLKHFKIEWPKQFETASSDVVKTQANTSVTVSAQFDSRTLGTQNIDVVNNPKGSIDRFDKALSVVSAERARLGKVKNQLDHSLRQQIIGTETHGSQHFLQARGELSSPDLLASQANKSPERVALLL